jgi:hypothetical protein
MLMKTDALAVKAGQNVQEARWWFQEPLLLLQRVWPPCRGLPKRAEEPTEQVAKPSDVNSFALLASKETPDVEPFEAKESDAPCVAAGLVAGQRQTQGMLALMGRLHGAEVHILVDSSKGSFVDTAAARTMRVKQQSIPVPDVVQLAYGSKQTSASTSRVRTLINDSCFVQDLHVESVG